MSLVAYAASSDEDSEEDVPAVTETVKLSKQPLTTDVPTLSTPFLNGTISDEDEDFTPVEDKIEQFNKKISLLLPPPKKQESLHVHKDLDEDVSLTFAKLPIPRSCNAQNTKVIEEADDEYLHKKEVPLDDEERLKTLPPAIVRREPVKISIPSLKDFVDVDKELAHRAKIRTESIKAPKGSGLLSILPKAKSEQVFNKQIEQGSYAAANLPSIPNMLIPDTVKNLRPAHNTEVVDGLSIRSKKKNINLEKNIPKTSLVNCSDSEEGSGNENDSDGDFFSLNSAETLPEVSTNEINIMVAKRAAKMAEATSKYLSSLAAATSTHTERQTTEEHDEAMRQAQKRFHDQQKLDDQAMHALVGGSSKRRRKQQQEIQVMDISSAQVLPDRDEWMRSALATSTAYQATGVLVDEEPASGTRRKHQITYLAHKAKANEAELQAMWAANRQTRRATQSKYGF